MRSWQLSQANALRLRCLLFMGLLIGGAPRVWATTYYVDPSLPNCAARNGNAGTDPANPWCNPPGTRKTGATGFFTSAWGAINGTTKVACGTLILLRGGTTHSSATGGFWNIESNYYAANCTMANPITITVATSAQWASSSGDFVIDGTGISAGSDLGTGGGPCPGTGHHVGLVSLENNSGLVFGGNGPGQRMHIRNVPTSQCNNCGILVAGQSNSEIRWVEINTKLGPTTGDPGAAVDFGQSNQVTLHDAYLHDWLGPGVDTGMSAVQTVSAIAMVDVLVENVGPSTDPAANVAGDAFSFQADAYNNNDPMAGGVWCIRCTAKNGYWNGGNSGGSDSPNIDNVVRYRNAVVYGNGRTASTSSARVGRESGGDAIWSGLALPCPSVWDFYPVYYDNYNQGIGMPHGDGAYYLWHATMFRAGTQGSALLYDACASITEVYNSIVATGSAFQLGWGGPNVGNTATRNNSLPVSANSLYSGANSAAQLSSVDTHCANNTGKKCRLQTDCTGGDGACVIVAGSDSYASPPGFLIGNGNKVNVSPGFTNATGSCDSGWGSPITTFSSCDFTLQPGSAAIDAGRTFFLLANGAGSNSNTITVKASTLEPYQLAQAPFNWSPPSRPHIADPRMYFIAANSFPHATADTIQIQNATCNPAGNPSVLSMNSTTITLDRSCTWADGAGVHLPWSGAAPDMGAYEYGSGPTPPHLMSVDVVTSTPGP